MSYLKNKRPYYDIKKVIDEDPALVGNLIWSNKSWIFALVLQYFWLRCVRQNPWCWTALTLIFRLLRCLEHLANVIRLDSDVRVVRISNQNIDFIPLDINLFFSYLPVLNMEHTKVKVITSNNLKPFRSLLAFFFLGQWDSHLMMIFSNIIPTLELLRFGAT